MQLVKEKEAIFNYSVFDEIEDIFLIISQFTTVSYGTYYF
jgi:hypothetical protein